MDQIARWPNSVTVTVSQCVNQQSFWVIKNVNRGGFCELWMYIFFHRLQN